MTGKMTLTLSAYAALPVSPQYGCPPAVLLDTDHVTQGCMFYSKGHRRIHYSACQINIFPAGQDPEWGGAQKKHNVKEISRTPRLKTQPRVMKQHRFRTKRKFLLCESVPVDYIGQPRFQIHPFHRTPAYSPPLGIPDHFKQLAALRDGDVVILILRNVGIGHVARPLKQEQRQQGTVDGLVPDDHERPLAG